MSYLTGHLVVYLTDHLMGYRTGHLAGHLITLLAILLAIVLAFAATVAWSAVLKDTVTVMVALTIDNYIGHNILVIPI